MAHRASCGLIILTRVIRSAMLQMRVTPPIGLALENVLERLDLNITEATETFYRRMIIDQGRAFHSM